MKTKNGIADENIGLVLLELGNNNSKSCIILLRQEWNIGDNSRALVCKLIALSSSSMMTGFGKGCATITTIIVSPIAQKMNNRKALSVKQTNKCCSKIVVFLCT